MYEGVYGRMLKAHAIKQFTKEPEFPNKNLGIGEDEKLSNCPVLVLKKPVQKAAVVEKSVDMPIEKVGGHFDAEMLDMTDFFYGDSLGEPLERV